MDAGMFLDQVIAHGNLKLKPIMCLYTGHHQSGVGPSMNQLLRLIVSMALLATTGEFGGVWAVSHKYGTANTVKQVINTYNFEVRQFKVGGHGPRIRNRENGNSECSTRYTDTGS